MRFLARGYTSSSSILSFVASSQTEPRLRRFVIVRPQAKEPPLSSVYDEILRLRSVSAQNGIFLCTPPLLPLLGGGKRLGKDQVSSRILRLDTSFYLWGDEEFAFLGEFIAVQVRT